MSRHSGGFAFRQNNAGPALDAGESSLGGFPRDHSRTLPRLAALFDPSTQQNFFKGSKVPELEELALTETQLLEQTAALLGVSLAQLVRAGALVYAKREFLGHKKYLSPPPAAAEGDSSQVALLRSGSGVAGVADTVSRPLLTPWQRLKSPSPRQSSPLEP